MIESHYTVEETEAKRDEVFCPPEITGSSIRTGLAGSPVLLNFSHVTFFHKMEREF